MNNDPIATVRIDSAGFDNDYTGQGKAFVRIKLQDGKSVATVYEKNNAVSIFFEECFRHLTNKFSGDERRFTLREFVASRYALTPDAVDKEAVVRNVRLVHSGSFKVSLADVIKTPAQADNAACLHQDPAGFKRSLTAISINAQVGKLLSDANKRYAEKLSEQIPVPGNADAQKDPQVNHGSVKPLSPQHSPPQLNLLFNGLGVGFDTPGPGFGKLVCASPYTEQIMHASKSDLTMAAGLASGISHLAAHEDYKDIFPKDVIIQMAQASKCLVDELHRRAILDGLKSVENFFSGLKDGLPSESAFKFMPSNFEKVKAFFGDGNEVRDFVSKIEQEKGVINGSNIELVIEVFEALVAASEERLIPADLTPCPVLGIIYVKAEEFLAATTHAELFGEIPKLPQSLHPKFGLTDTRDGKDKQELADLTYDKRLRDELTERKKDTFIKSIESLSLTVQHRVRSLNAEIHLLSEALMAPVEEFQRYATGVSVPNLSTEDRREEFDHFSALSRLVSHVGELFGTIQEAKRVTKEDLASVNETLALIERLNRAPRTADVSWEQEPLIADFVSVVRSMLPPAS